MSQVTCLLVDEKKNAGQQIPIHQGEIKLINVFWFDPSGAPHIEPTISELKVKIYNGNAGSPLEYTLGGSAVTLLQCSQLSGYIGFQFTMAAADTGALPINVGNAMSVTVINSTTLVQEFDLAAAFVVSSPLVP